MSIINIEQQHNGSNSLQCEGPRFEADDEGSDLGTDEEAEPESMYSDLRSSAYFTRLA